MASKQSRSGGWINGAKTVAGIGFKGMSNLPGMPGYLTNDARQIIPKVVVNADATDGGVLQRRKGYALDLSMPGLCNVWGGTVMLGVCDGVLYRLEGQSAIPLGDVGAGLMNYLELGTRVYLSTKFWNGILDLLTFNLDSWGLALPALPDISFTQGNLPPGRYNICYTRTVGKRLSGNGPIISVAWDGGPQGIQFKNLDDSYQVWVTQANGPKLFLATMQGNKFLGPVPKVSPLPSFMVAPPPPFAHFWQAFGRMWGVSGNNLCYSEPFQYEWFKPKNFIPFPEELNMVVPVMEGIFVNSLNSTWYLPGSSPGKLVMTRVGEGAVPGSLAWAPLESGHYTISRPHSLPPSPYWMSPTGFIGASHSGHLVTLTQPRLKVVAKTQGASLYEFRDGIPKIITTLRGSPLAEPDETLKEIFATGRIFVPAPLEVVGEGGVDIGGEIL